MKGRTVGSLRVFLINASGARIILWSQSGEQGTDWKQAHRSISTNTPYRVRAKLNVAIFVHHLISLLIF